MWPRWPTAKAAFPSVALSVISLAYQMWAQEVIIDRFETPWRIRQRYTTTATYGSSAFLTSALLNASYSNSFIEGKIGVARQSSDTLQGDSSLVIRRSAWNNWDSTQDYTASTLPAVIGSLGGLWSAFGGVLAGIFGTSIAFIVFGEEITRPVVSYKYLRPLIISPITRTTQDRSQSALSR